MVDLESFTDEKFDAKKWINVACKSRRPQYSIDNYLVDLEMKLQMASEEIAASLEEQSTAALLRVPRASRDVIHLRDDALSLRSAISSIVLALKRAEGSSAESVAALAKIDIVKQRMEAAYETLQDAAGLTQLSLTVEDVFASGDLASAAETLANMRHCLFAIGEVAEFANVRKQVEELENRLDRMVEPCLTDALSCRKVDVAQNLRGILIAFGRFKSLEIQYINVHLRPIKKLWDEFESRQHVDKPAVQEYNVYQSTKNTIMFSTWLPSFYDELLIYLEQEWKWCMAVFPDDYRTLVPKLVIETMMSLTTSFVSRINLATGDVVPESKAFSKGMSDVLSEDMPIGIRIQSRHLERLIELHNITGTFARNIQYLFSESDLPILVDTLKAVYIPYESFKQRYGQMEHAILTSEISGINLRGAVARSVGAQGIELSETVRRMEESIPQVIVILEASVERCITFTGGSEADELMLVLDDVMLQYISTLQEILKSLRVVCGVDSLGNGFKKEMGSDKKGARKVEVKSNDEEWSIVQGALQILTVADCLTSRSSVLEAFLRGTLARLRTSLSFSVVGSNVSRTPTIVTGDEGDGEYSLAGKAALDMAAVRLVDAPNKARDLFKLFDQTKDPQFHALPLTSQRVAAFAETVNELVYEVLISNVRQRLRDVAHLPIWSSVDESSTSFSLPNFSAYPQSYVTSVGEYLLTLPQQLEPLAEGSANSDANTDEVQLFATEWMFKVAEGTCGLYLEQLRGIQYLTDRGAQQLAVDLDYLSNVLSALSMPIPHVLSTFHTCLSTPGNELKGLVKKHQQDSESQFDLLTANLVCKIRRVSIDQ